MHQYTVTFPKFDLFINWFLQRNVITCVVLGVSSAGLNGNVCVVLGVSSAGLNGNVF